MELSHNFRENLREAMARQGLTQRALAEASGVHYVTICNVLAGKITPSLATCQALAEAAKMKIPKIFAESR